MGLFIHTQMFPVSLTATDSFGCNESRDTLVTVVDANFLWEDICENDVLQLKDKTLDTTDFALKKDIDSWKWKLINIHG